MNHCCYSDMRLKAGSLVTNRTSSYFSSTIIIFFCVWIDDVITLTPFSIIVVAFNIIAVHDFGENRVGRGKSRDPRGRAVGLQSGVADGESALRGHSE
jgi:hypothetical protein